MGKTPAEIGIEVARLYCLAKGIIAVGLSEYDPLVRVVAAAIREDRAEAVSEAEVERFGQEMASIVDEEWPPKREPEEARKYARIICEAARKARTE